MTNPELNKPIETQESGMPKSGEQPVPKEGLVEVQVECGLISKSTDPLVGELMKLTGELVGPEDVVVEVLVQKPEETLDKKLPIEGEDGGETTFK